MLRRFLIKTARIITCVILGLTIGIGGPLVLEKLLPGYKYYGEVE